MSSPQQPSSLLQKALKPHIAMRHVLEVTYCSVPEIKDLMLAVKGLATIETQTHIVKYMGMCFLPPKFPIFICSFVGGTAFDHQLI